MAASRCENGRLVGVSGTASHLLMHAGHKQTSGPSALRKSDVSLTKLCLLIYV